MRRGIRKLRWRMDYESRTVTYSEVKLRSRWRSLAACSAASSHSPCLLHPTLHHCSPDLPQCPPSSPTSTPGSSTPWIRSSVKELYPSQGELLFEEEWMTGWRTATLLAFYSGWCTAWRILVRVYYYQTAPALLVRVVYCLSGS